MGKYVTLRCVCGEKKVFEGKDVDEILDRIDRSGWVDGEATDLCPDCAETADKWRGHK